MPNIVSEKGHLGKISAKCSSDLLIPLGGINNHNVMITNTTEETASTKFSSNSTMSFSGYFLAAVGA